MQWITALFIPKNKPQNIRLCKKNNIWIIYNILIQASAMMFMKARMQTGRNLHGVKPLMYVMQLVIFMEVTILGELFALNLKLRIFMLLWIKVVIELLQWRSQEAQSVHHRILLIIIQVPLGLREQEERPSLVEQPIIMLQIEIEMHAMWTIIINNHK